MVYVPCPDFILFFSALVQVLIRGTQSRFACRGWHPACPVGITVMESLRLEKTKTECSLCLIPNLISEFILSGLAFPPTLSDVYIHIFIYYYIYIKAKLRVDEGTEGLYSGTQTIIRLD